MKKIKQLIRLFLIFLKIGLFTFGGGYAMIALLESEFVEKRKWISGKDFSDMIAVAESTPGPLAINSATFLGYKLNKTAGALIATIGVCIPSFAILYLISLFFQAFLSLEAINAAFRGISVCVVFLILSTGIKLMKQLKRTPFHCVVFLSVFVCIVLFSVFGIGFSSVFYILISGCAGLFLFLISYLKQRGK